MQEKLFLLPIDVLEAQLSAVDLLIAMYPDEVDIPTSTSQCMEKLRACLEKSAAFPSPPPTISLTVHLSVNNLQTIQLNISVPFHSSDPEPLEPPPMTYTLRQPPWLTKADLAQLSASLPQDDVVTAFEYIQNSAPKFLKSAPNSSNHALTSKGPTVRVWFYFPSLSTREKRDDLVNHAPGYSLTGFVLAGKPGLLCLEGTSVDIDSYMKFIKTESWGDIPSHQKKVSERYREQGVGRVFEGMEEITDEWERGGQRANRSDS